jgi:predicted porin
MIKQLIAAAAITLVAASSHAEEPGKVYAGVDFGSTHFDGRYTSESNKASYGAFVGYQLTPSLALEGGYRSLYDQDSWGVKGSADQLSLSLIGSYPLSARTSLYGRIGASRITEKYSDSTFSIKDHEDRALLGVGVSNKLTDKVSLRLELQKVASHATNLSVGASYAF